jgi:Flp pilus assembly protein TadG
MNKNRISPCTSQARAANDRRPGRRRLRCTRRRAAAAVEFAAVLPVVVLMLLGSVELGRAVMVNHEVQGAARAGCRLYSVRDTSQEDVNEIIARSMSLAGITEYSVTYDPATKDEIDTAMEPVTVTISVAYSHVAWVSPAHLFAATIVGSCTLPADIEEEEDAPTTTYTTTSDDYDGDGWQRDDDHDDDDHDDDDDDGWRRRRR